MSKLIEILEITPAHGGMTVRYAVIDGARRWEKEQWFVYSPTFKAGETWKAEEFFAHRDNLYKAATPTFL